MDKEFYTVKDLAKKLSCNERTIRRMVARGEMSHHKMSGLVRFSQVDVTKYIEESRVATKEKGD